MEGRQGEGKMRLTFRYSIIQVFFWSIVAVIMNYASVFLLGKGFRNTEIGLMIAFASLISACLGPLIGAWSDHPKGPTVRTVLLASVAVFLLAMFLVIFFDGRSSGLLLLSYGAAAMIIQSMMAMTNALGTMSAREGHKVNFGIARGVGSLSFAVAALALGPLTVGFGNDIIPWLGVILYAGLGAAVLFFPMKKQAVSAARAKRAGFASRYPRFMVFLAASVCLYTAHSLLNNFMFQIISAKGGGNEALGVASAIAAVVELPVMFAFTRLLKILPVGRWLIISGFAFLLKSLVTFLTPAVGGLYAAQALQIFAFAVMAVASVYYTDQIMEPQDAVKGQAFLSMTATAGAVIASSCGGWILDVSGVNMLLIVSITFAAVGALIAWLCLRKQPAG